MEPVFSFCSVNTRGAALHTLTLLDCQSEASEHSSRCDVERHKRRIKAAFTFVVVVVVVVTTLRHASSNKSSFAVCVPSSIAGLKTSIKCQPELCAHEPARPSGTGRPWKSEKNRIQGREKRITVRKCFRAIRRSFQSASLSSNGAGCQGKATAANGDEGGGGSTISV